jgi:hypothetical protein
MKPEPKICGGGFRTRNSMVPAMVKKTYVTRIYDESRKRYILVDVLNPKPKSLKKQTVSDECWG